MEVDAKLLDYCVSDRQREIVQAVIKAGTAGKAARMLGIHAANVRRALAKVKARSQSKGWAPEHDRTHAIPEIETLKGVSTYYRDDGSVGGQWVKTSVKHEQLVALMREVVDELKADVAPIEPVVLSRESLDMDLLNLYTLTDIHIGMKSWREETGADWDLSIAEQTVVDAFAYLIDRSPPARVGFFNQLGDALHSDGLLPVTPTSGHVLDQDGRFHKVVRTVIRVFRRVIDMLLAKHEQVVVLMASGNHDPASSVWLQEMFAALYENNPRVQIIVSPLPYYAYQHGEVMLGFHHGHKAKAEKLPGVFMGSFRKMFGDTRQAYIHTGHLHDTTVVESPGVIVERHPTLAARDAYCAHGGWHSLRSMKCITYHAKRLEMGRCQYVPEVAA